MFFGSSNYAFNDPVALNDPSGADPWWEFGPNGASRLETTTDRWQRTGDANLSTRSRGPRIWNPWAGNQGKDGRYTGGWIPLNSFEGQMFYFNKFGADSRIKIDDSDAQQGGPGDPGYWEGVRHRFAVMFGMEKATAEELKELLNPDGSLKVSAGTADLPMGPGSLGMARKIVQAKGLVSPQTLKAAKSYYRQTLEHIEKLRKYIANPSAYDNAGHLAKNAGNPQIQQQIMNGRISHLQHEIKTFYNNFWKLFE